MTASYSRKLFIVAALFNVLAGLPFLVALQPVAALMGLQITTSSTLFIHLTMGMVVIFGWVYWMIARDPVRWRPYILLGIILKLFVVVVIHSHWLAGNIAWPLPTLACGDILFALLFWRYYQSTSEPIRG